MRVLALVGALVCLLATRALAWDKDDHEIFELVSALEAAEGKGTTFYSFLNLTKAATPADINRQARKRSLELHPDKNPGVKDAPERFSRLGVIVAILRDPEKRKRYNFFHDNGVPRWKGTGYMYSRWQPGLGFALSIILLFATFAQYGIQHATYRSELARITRFQKAARLAAYGRPTPDAPPTSERKKVRVPLNAGRVDVTEDGDDEDDSGAASSRAARRAAAGKGRAAKREATASGALVTMIVEGKNVWIQTEDGGELPLDASAAKKPSLLDTFVPNLTKSLGIGVLPRKAISADPAPTNGVASPAHDDDTTADEIVAPTSSVAGGSGPRRRKGGKGRR